MYDRRRPFAGFLLAMPSTSHLIHCSYHKCLTVYFKRVFHGLFNRLLPWSAGYRHFNSHLDDFYASFESLRVASVNNRALDLERLGPFRITRFLRDPRDLVVSGYFYHRRGAEEWVRKPAPTAQDWYFANGCLPRGLVDHGGSFAEYLQSVPLEEGLLAELEFRRHHFESMADWPREHPRILTFRYEEMLGHETEVFRRLFEFYELATHERALGMWLARRYSIRKIAAAGDAHVRNPSSGQWREHFTPRVRKVFDAEYGGLIRQLGYSSD